MNRKLINWLGLLGVVSLLSYTAAVFISPSAYPGYNALAQGVSDLSAEGAPSRTLWMQLSSLYTVCGITSIMMVCVFVQRKLNAFLRTGVYTFALMQWVSAVGYAMFPLTEVQGTTTQDMIHVYVITPLVVILSILSLVFIMIGGYRNQRYMSIAIFAAIALAIMALGAIGVAVVPKAYFGIPERFSVFAATGFNAVLGVYLFTGFQQYRNKYY